MRHDARPVTQNPATEPDRVDLRVRRSRKMLRDALVALIAERGFDAINISDITTRAMVNRATFYRHFKDKQDLLARCMDDVLDELVTKTTPPFDSAGQTIQDATFHNITLLFEHVAEHAKFYQVMLGKDGAGAFNARIRLYLQEVIRQRMKIVLERLAPQPFVPIIPTEMIVSSIASTIIGVVVWWLESGQPYSPAQTAQYAVLLVVLGPSQALGLPMPELPTGMFLDRSSR